MGAQPRYSTANQPVARDHVSRTMIMSQLTWIKMSIPAILPIRNEPGILHLLQYCITSTQISTAKGRTTHLLLHYSIRLTPAHASRSDNDSRSVRLPASLPGRL